MLDLTIPQKALITPAASAVAEDSRRQPDQPAASSVEEESEEAEASVEGEKSKEAKESEKSKEAKESEEASSEEAEKSKEQSAACAVVQTYRPLLVSAAEKNNPRWGSSPRRRDTSAG